MGIQKKYHTENMSSSCRHCAWASCSPPDDTENDQGGELSGASMTYMSVLTFGGAEVINAKLKKIETEMGVIGGVSTWCERCRRCSVISYASYIHQLNSIPLGGEPPMCRLDYYGHMCHLAEMLTGEKGLGFAFSAPKSQIESTRLVVTGSIVE